jgi:hypothetical protein
MILRMRRLALAARYGSSIASISPLLTCVQVILTALKGVSDLGTSIFVDVLTEVCDISGVRKLTFSVV